jgi:2-desacetyl-2-hydroxyethyl bacteriochlorophyllide A dehydrogenase
MQALVFTGPGQLQVRDVPRPTPSVGEALVRVKYAGICGSDLHIWHGLWQVTPPIILGHEVVGDVVESRADELAVGTRVAVEPRLRCGTCRACREGQTTACRRSRATGVRLDGGAAEYQVHPAALLHPLPDTLSWEQAALTEPTAVAVRMIRRAGVQVGDTVLVLGGGPIGFLAASMARAAGAGRVVISELSSPRIDFCRSAGFEVIDASATDPAEAFRASTDGEGADVVVEAVGHPSTIGVMLEAVRTGGTVLAGGVYTGEPPTALRQVMFKELRLVGSLAYESREVRAALGLLARGALPVDGLVTRIVPLERAVEDGFAALERSRGEMKVLLAP